MPEKIYCYVDETGQDTQGDLFIVSVVITGRERDSLIERCAEIEQRTRKGRIKWIKTDYTRRVEYIRQILAEPAFRGKLNFASYRNTRDYLPRTVLTIARAITALALDDYKASVLIDGLPRAQEKWVGIELRHLRIKIKKVRGVLKEENDALVRLADALCGFVRAALEGQAEMRKLFERAKKSGTLKEL
ncbi:MAG: DUF3800 domain-containing protein [Chloroflexi bacterium]|nr:DUF3800 domain-containing protein [Chloroflexota bacterium]